jgi:hypothetical protein
VLAPVRICKFKLNKMGYIKHNAIVCTTWKEEDAVEAQLKAKEIFESKRKGSSQLISELVEYIVNGGYSFFIAPDGSKEGWEDSKQCDDARKDFLDWLKESDNYCDYVEIRFGGDDEHENIVRSKDTDYEEM